MEVQAGQVNFRGSLPYSENNVLQPILHPGYITTQEKKWKKLSIEGTYNLHFRVGMLFSANSRVKLFN